MSEKHRSLASYFEEPGEISQSWHDQTEPLQAPPSLSGLGNSSHTGLTGYMYVPGYASMLWVPKNMVPADAAKNSESTTYHFKGQPWRETDWGYTEHERMVAEASQPISKQPKEAKTKMTPEERKAYKAAMASTRQKTRETRSQSINTLHKATNELMVGNRAWNENIYPVITSITTLLESAKSDSRNKVSELKTAGKEGREKKELLHAKTTYVINDASWTGGAGRSGLLQKIDDFCRQYSLMNTLGMNLPEANEDGSRYLSVAIMFLGKAKEVIMSGTLHHLAQKAKTGACNEAECAFINTSYAANNIIAKIRGKDRYMRKYDPKLEDSEELGKCRHMIMELEKQRWTYLNSQSKQPKPLPKHFQMAPPHKGHKKKDKKHDERSHDARKREVELIVELLEQRDKKHQTGHGRPHHKKNTDNAPPREASARPGPARVNPAMVNPRLPRRNQAYMHGYYY